MRGRARGLVGTKCYCAGAGEGAGWHEMLFLRIMSNDGAEYEFLLTGLFMNSCF